MRRRAFIASLGALASSVTLSALAQRRAARLGFLGTGSADTSAIFVAALQQGLRENGLLEGRDYELDIGWAEGRYERFPELAKQMVDRHVNVILATTISAVRAAQGATNSIPIVMTSINDPVGAGLVKSLAQPGGNTTGLASLAEDVTTKLLELLHATIPSAKDVAVLLNPANPSNPRMFDGLKGRTGTSDINVRRIEVSTPEELDSAFAGLAKNPPDALLVLPDFMLIDQRNPIATLALRSRLPLITNVPEYTDAGALVSYGAPRRENYRRSARYVKRILNGTKPAELPVEQPTDIEFSINLKTAKVLGVQVSDALLARAHRVIE